MVRTTPFHDRLSALNTTGLWQHWSGHLVAVKYQSSEKFEYFAVRNGAGLTDTSPLYKYRISGTGATEFLARTLVRDVRTCAVGEAQYTLWCDDAGHVVEDGVVFRTGDDEYLLTTAEPNEAHFDGLIGRSPVSITDVSDEFASLAVQGPLSRELLAGFEPSLAALPYFHHAPARIGGVEVRVSRTGYTGDLGYEIWTPSEHAGTVLDAVLDASGGRGIHPAGQAALLMLRVEAGLLLVGVDFHSSRFAFTDQQRSTPHELGFGWMTRGIEGRAYVGRDAIVRERAEGRTRWSTVGLVVDWQAWDERYRAAGIIPPKDPTPVVGDMLLLDDAMQRIGYTTTFMYSPVLQRHIALARVVPAHAAPGTVVHLEVTIDHRHQVVPATVTRTPLYNPPRRTDTP